jgi:hypothetical protein
MPGLLFSVTLPSGGSNTFSFPSFSTYPKLPGHLAYAGVFAFASFRGNSDESPWIAFDSANNAFLLSPASHFMVSRTSTLSTGELATGVSMRIASLPPGFTQQALLVISSGINRGFDTWGTLLTGVTGKKRPPNDADVTLSRVGYWTDAGSSYYYSTEPGMTYPETLSAVQNDFLRQGISLGYMQLDSWFYPKGPAADWASMSSGIYEYRAAASEFPMGLRNFQRALGIPLIAHARWIDPSSPYWQQYRMSGTVSIDPLYWGDVSRYLSDSGVVTFEQDWLADKAATAFNLSDGDEFLNQMASAMAQQRMTVQYCSGTARHFLQSAAYDNVTTVRTSMDRFQPARWTQFLYASRLAGAVGTWPFTDVFMSAETGNLIMATLSAGPLGVGDRIGSLDAENLRRSIRSDGVIVKPDVPLAPIDRSFWSDSQGLQLPMISATYTDFNGLRAWYLFAYAQSATAETEFRLEDAGIDRRVYLYDYSSREGRMATPQESLVIHATDFRYLIAAPVGPSGIAFLGDTGQFVTLGKKRITAYFDDGSIHATIGFAPGERFRTLEGYSPDRPCATAAEGSIGRLHYDPESGRFSMRVSPGADGFTTIEIGRGRNLEPRPTRGTR